MEISGIWGQFSVTVDDKGRLSLPAKIRRRIDGERLVLTKGAEQCLWLYLPEPWEELSRRLVEGASDFSLSSQGVLRRFVAPAEEVFVDNSGRVKLSGALMQSMGIKRDCYVLGMRDRLEIWDQGAYEAFERAHEQETRQTWEQLGGGQ